MKHANKWRWGQYGILLSILATAVLIYSIHTPTQIAIQELFYVLRQMDAQLLKSHLLEYGIWAGVVSVGLMLAQAILAPLPAFAITMANGLIFGWFWGGLLSLVSAVAAAQMCFEIARVLGRPMIERMVGVKQLSKADSIVQRYGVSAIVIARLLPIMPFDPLSYGAGLTGISRKYFIGANLVGQLPATFIYSYFGDQLLDGMPGSMLAALVLLAILVVIITYWLNKYDLLEAKRE